MRTWRRIGPCPLRCRRFRQGWRCSWGSAAVAHPAHLPILASSLCCQSHGLIQQPPMSQEEINRREMRHSIDHISPCVRFKKMKKSSSCGADRCIDGSVVAMYQVSRKRCTTICSWCHLLRCCVLLLRNVGLTHTCPKGSKRTEEKRLFSIHNQKNLIDSLLKERWACSEA